MLQVGDYAPDFTLVDQNKNEVTLSSFKGKKVLLSWHPLAFTSVCTDQMRALSRAKYTFEQHNTVALGLSVDAQPAKAVWAQALGLKTPILADFGPFAGVTKAYGLFDEESGTSKRANVLVDEEGKVAWIKVYPTPELPDLDEVLAQL